METEKIASLSTEKPTAAEVLVFLAKLHYEFIRTVENDYLAVPLSGPKIAKNVKGGNNSLGDDLMRRFREHCGKIPSERAVNDAVRVIMSDASTSDPVETYLRYARVADSIYVDLGDSTGEAIEVTRDGWKIIERAPVYFRRTALIAPFPRPRIGGDINQLFEIVNIPEELRGVVIGFLISSMDESISHPIPGVNGEQGSGKTSLCRKLSSLIDPSPVPVQSPPRDLAALQDIAAGVYVVSLDNLSKYSDALSDGLCTLVSGGAAVRRKLYEDKDQVVLKFKRVVILNGINLTEMREDLADRVIPIHLPRISPEQRRLESELDSKWVEIYPDIFGAMLSLCSQVLGILPTLTLKSMPRMADFGRYLAALDEIRGTDSFNQFIKEIEKSAANSVDSDPFLKALETHLDGTWSGTASELLKELSPYTPFGVDRSWPNNAKQVTEKLARTAPTLRKAGWLIEDMGSNNHLNRRKWVITPAASYASQFFTLHTKEKEESGGFGKF
jgi:hypothetical protein